jgi:hypothetical protein
MSLSTSIHFIFVQDEKKSYTMAAHFRTFVQSRCHEKKKRVHEQSEHSAQAYQYRDKSALRTATNKRSLSFHRPASTLLYTRLYNNTIASLTSSGAIDF